MSKVQILTMSIIVAAAFSTNTALAERKKAKPEKMTKQAEVATPAAPVNPAASPVLDGTSAEVKYVMTSNLGEQKFEDVVLMRSRTLVAADTTTEMKSISFGLRKKAVFGLVPVRVYTAQLLAAYPEKLVHTGDGFLASLKAAGPVQLRLTFLRDLPGPKITESFKEGLDANKVNIKNMYPEMATVMSEISAVKQFMKEDSFSITAVWKDNKSTLLLEDSLKIKSVTGSADLANDIFSIWFGKPADGKLADLKKELIKQ